MENYTRKEADGYLTVFYNSKNQVHRIDGPARIWHNGRVEYWVYDKRHNIDGPAIVCPVGGLQYWILGVNYTKKQYDNHPDVVKYKIEQHLLGA
jgi:hypothetical protein